MATLKHHKSIVGGLSHPSKMPGYAFGIPARKCQVGARLVKVKGSTCQGCYALKGMYQFPTVQNAQGARFDKLTRALTNKAYRAEWVESMATLIDHYSRDYFRWHDSGDLQSADHLALIVQICKLTPNTKHWIPTREYAHVLTFMVNGGEVPSNLCIRLSAHMVDGKVPSGYGLPTSSVHKSAAPIGNRCPAPTQDNECGECRSCWDTNTANVSYHLH